MCIRDRINSDKVCHSYSDMNFGVTFFGTRCIYQAFGHTLLKLYEIWWSLLSERRMSSGRLASTVCPHVGGKADQCSAMSAADCAGQVTRWGSIFRAGVCHEKNSDEIYYQIIVCVWVLCILGEVLLLFTLHCCGEVQCDRCPTLRKCWRHKS